MSTSVGWLDVAEKGSVRGIQALVWICTRFGRAPGRFVLRFIALYYVVFHGSARRASRDYLRRVHGNASFRMIYAHVLCFAQAALDRMFMAVRCHRIFDVTSYGAEQIQRLGKERRGAILLGAHLGSFEALRMQADADELRINVVGNFRNARMINAALSKLHPGADTRVINVDATSMGFVLEIKERLARGEMVAILGDRVGPGVRAVDVRFFGADAPFPTGAYQLAAMLHCPIYLTFGLYRGGNRYDVHCELFEEQVTLPRKARPEALHAYAQRFAERLEHFARIAPDNWFNFYDFWRAPPSPEATP